MISDIYHSSTTTTTTNNHPMFSNNIDQHFSFQDSEDTVGFDGDSPTVGVAEEPEVRCDRRKRRGRLASILSLFSSFSSRDKKNSDALPLLSPGEQLPKHPRRRARISKVSRCLLFILVGIFVMLGIIQSISIACSVVISFFPDEFDRAATNWLTPYYYNSSTDDGSHWPTDISRDIIPVGCHSHNDYWRRIPLFSALQAGCIGVEADIWFMDQKGQGQGQDLYVGHTASSLTPQRTLKSMYVDPLVKILDRQNQNQNPITPFHSVVDVDQPRHGVFDTNLAQTLILLVDFKTDGAATWPQVVEQMAPLRERGYLTYFNGEEVINGPITVVGTGNTPFDLVISNPTYRDIFFDAPLGYLAEDATSTNANQQRRTTRQSTSNDNDNLGQGLSGTSTSNLTPDTFNSTNSFYASTSFKRSIGSPWPFHLTAQQMDSIRAQVRGAHRRGLKVRYWGLPNWPRGLRNHVWSVLVREGVDILNVDDLQSATKKEWTSKAFDWW